MINDIHKIDPNGDTVIILRNPLVEFAPWPSAEEQVVPEVRWKSGNPAPPYATHDHEWDSDDKENESEEYAVEKSTVSGYTAEGLFADEVTLPESSFGGSTKAESPQLKPPLLQRLLPSPMPRRKVVLMKKKSIITSPHAI